MDYAGSPSGGMIQPIQEQKIKCECAYKELIRTVRLYLEDAEDKNTMINHLLRYIDNNDEAGINNLFLNAKNSDVKTSYHNFLSTCGTDRKNLQTQFDNLYGYLLSLLLL